MSRVHLGWHGYRYLPYERELAKREVAAVFGEQPVPADGGLIVDTNGHPRDRVKRLTYFRSATFDAGITLTTDQATLEGSARIECDLTAVTAAARKQSTRYSTHGLHD